MGETDNGVGEARADMRAAGGLGEGAPPSWVGREEAGC